MLCPHTKFNFTGFCGPLGFAIKRMWPRCCLTFHRNFRFLRNNDIFSWTRFDLFLFVTYINKKYLISFQKSAAVHVARHCPSTRTERIFMDWLWWIVQGLPFTHLVSFWNLILIFTLLITVIIFALQRLCSKTEIQKTVMQVQQNSEVQYLLYF
jgi:hypothetical protein